MQPDWRTDNWAGHRDPGRDPKNYSFPRSAREAGFYYGPEQKEEPNMIFIIICLLILVMGCIAWAG